MFRVMDATCKFLGLGQGTDPLYICPSQFRSCLPSQFRSGPLPSIGHEPGQPVLKQAGRLRNGLSCKSGLNIYIMNHWIQNMSTTLLFFYSTDPSTQPKYTFGPASPTVAVQGSAFSKELWTNFYSPRYWMLPSFHLFKVFFLFLVVTDICKTTIPSILLSMYRSGLLIIGSHGGELQLSHQI